MPAAAYDAVLCIGAAFVWGHIGDAAAAIAPAAAAGGRVAIGEPFWQASQPADGVPDEGFVDLAGTVERFTSTGLSLTAVVASSDDEWDHVESQHWRAIDEWLRENPDHPDDPAVREQDKAPRDIHIHRRRERLRWAIFVGRLTASSRNRFFRLPNDC